MNPGDKRLAMMTEDHPYDYKDFEGTIPDGNYGAGIMEIWDKGSYLDIVEDDKTKSEGKILEGINKGNIKFRLFGNKLKGEFALVKLHTNNNKGNAWLLIKHKDEYAIMEKYDSENFTDSDSPINQWLQQNTNFVKPATSLKK
jgi:bifunctional non-homologous end joining protein LigD